MKGGAGLGRSSANDVNEIVAKEYVRCMLVGMVRTVWGINENLGGKKVVGAKDNGEKVRRQRVGR